MISSEKTSGDGDLMEFPGDDEERPRKRTLNACDTCKNRHLKCDGNGKNTCSTCNNLKTNCTYIIPAVKRGPKLHQEKLSEKAEIPLFPASPNQAENKFNLTKQKEQDWGGLVNLFNEHIKPSYTSILEPINLETDRLEHVLSSGKTQDKFLTLAVLANGAMIARNMKLATQFANEANSMLGEILGRVSFEIAVGLLFLASFYCVGVGEFVRGAGVLAVANQMTDMLEFLGICSDERKKRALSSLKARILSRLILNTTDVDERERLLSKAKKLTSLNNMESFFILHSYIVGKTRDINTNDQTEALHALISQADETVNQLQESTEVPSWVIVMMRTMMDSSRISLLHKLGEYEQAKQLLDKVHTNVDKEISAKHFGVNYQCEIMAVFNLYEEFGNLYQVENHPNLQFSPATIASLGDPSPSHISPQPASPASFNLEEFLLQ